MKIFGVCDSFNSPPPPRHYFTTGPLFRLGVKKMKAVVFPTLLYPIVFREKKPFKANYIKVTGVYVCNNCRKLYIVCTKQDIYNRP